MVPVLCMIPSESHRLPNLPAPLKFRSRLPGERENRNCDCIYIDPIYILSEPGSITSNVRMHVGAAYCTWQVSRVTVLLIFFWIPSIHTTPIPIPSHHPNQKPSQLPPTLLRKVTTYMQPLGSARVRVRVRIRPVGMPHASVSHRACMHPSSRTNNLKHSTIKNKKITKGSSYLFHYTPPSAFWGPIPISNSSARRLLF